MSMVYFFPCCCWVENTHTDADENNSDVAQYCDADYSTSRLCSYVMLLPFNTTIFSVCSKYTAQSVLVFCMHGAPE